MGRDPMSRTPRITARLRLTLLYLSLFVGLGAVLLALNYQLVANDLPTADKVVTVRLPAGPFPVGAGAIGVGTAGPTAPFDPPSVGQALKVTPADLEKFQAAVDESATESITQSVAEYRTRTLNDLVRKSGLALGITALVAAALGWWTAGRILRPLHVITATARKLTDDNLHERLNFVGPRDELRDLADTFDSMLDRLESSFAAERRLVANASHELRTPLAIQRTLLEVGLRDPSATESDLREMGEQVLTQTTRHERLVNRMLLLAQARNTPLELAEVDLSELVETATRAADRDDITIATNLDRTAAVRADPILIETLVANLVGNAVSHNLPGGWVTITVAAPPAGQVELIVENSGALLPADQVERLLEPFRRGARDRTGSSEGVGLGLALVATIAERHGWDLSVRARPEGGLTAAVAFTQPT